MKPYHIYYVIRMCVVTTHYHSLCLFDKKKYIKFYSVSMYESEEKVASKENGKQNNGLQDVEF